MMCPLCFAQNCVLYDQEKHRSYFQCQTCDLVFVPRNELLNPLQEKGRYEAHENEGDEYEKYLEKIANQILPHLSKNARGLDFGSGKSKILQRFLDVSSYDVFFHPDEALLTQKYDFILLSEVIEHLRNPVEELTKLKSLLHSDGMLFVKTKLLPGSHFSQWFYKRDRTHVQFFNERSLNFVASQWNFHQPQMIGEDLFLFRNK